MNYLVLIGVLAIGAGIGFIIAMLIYSDNVKKLESNLKFTDGYLYEALEEIVILTDRRDRAIAALTPNAASIGRKMARILRGEE